MTGKQNMETPQWMFDILNSYVHDRTGTGFLLDAAATKENAKCGRFYTKEDNSLILPWNASTFCNPPFKNFGDWIEHGYEEAHKHGHVVCFVGPVGCSQKRFHTFAQKGTILVPNKRISFVDPDTGKQTKGANRDTMIYLFGHERNASYTFWNPHKDRFLVKILDVREVW